MFVDEPVYVMGHGEAAAHVAMIMLNVTDDVDILTRGAEPTWSDETAAQLDAHPVEVVSEDVTGRGERPRPAGWRRWSSKTAPAASTAAASRCTAPTTTPRSPRGSAAI